MKSSDFRREAREKLTGKWGKAAIIVLIYTLFYFALGFIEGLIRLPDFLTNIINIVIEIPIIYGLTFVFIKLFNSEETSFKEMFTLGFENFARSWKIQLYTLLKMLVLIIMEIVAVVLLGLGAGITSAGMLSASAGASGVGAIILVVAFILLIVSSILLTMKSYYYKLALFIGIENPDMPEKKVVATSEQLMSGIRGKLFALDISFIGWTILASLTFGIGYLFLLPYIIFAGIAFYKNITSDRLHSQYSVKDTQLESNENIDTTSNNSSDSVNTSTFDDVLNLSATDNNNNNNNNDSETSL